MPPPKNISFCQFAMPYLLDVVDHPWEFFCESGGYNTPMQWLPEAFLNISSMHVLLPKRVYANFLKGESQQPKFRWKVFSYPTIRCECLPKIPLNSRYSRLFRSTCDGFIKVKTFKTSLHSTHRRRQALQPFCGKNNVRMKNQIKSAFLPNELQNPLQQEGGIPHQ